MTNASFDKVGDTLRTDPSHVPHIEHVNHPAHYNRHPSGVECIEIIRHMPCNPAMVIKYLWRCGLKADAPSIQDLEKAAWYLADEIQMRKNAERTRAALAAAEIVDDGQDENGMPYGRGGPA